MSDFWNPPKRTEAEWDALPPLVAKGNDRATKLGEVVAGWCTESPAGVLADAAEHVKAKGFALDSLDLVDANTDPPTPIDLGELLRAAEQTLRGNRESEEFSSSLDLHIVLRGCRVRVCKASNIKIRPRWTAVGSRFDARPDFADATFGDMADFAFATFRNGAGFTSATLGDESNFKSATFGDGAAFESATFGNGSSFKSATFGNKAVFRSATFGDGADFESTAFGDGADLGVATFGDRANFIGATFGKKALFVSTTFGNDACFGATIFGEGAYFIGADFGERATFGSATFDGWARFDIASMGNGADFSSATFGERADFVSATFGSDADFRNARFQPGGGPGGLVVASLHPRAPQTNSDSSWGGRFRGTADQLERVRRWLVVRVSWNFVRAAGESAILNRVSMLALVIVPLVAGVWPAVRSLVHGYAFGFGGARGVYEFESARAKLLMDALRVPGAESVPVVLGKLDTQVDRIALDLQNAAEGTVSLPVSWSLLFFGALAVTLGRTVYGWGAPNEVRLHGPEEAMAAGAKEFREKKDQSRDLILRAITRLQEAAEQLPEVRHPSFVSRHGAAVWVPKSMEEFDEFRNTHEKDTEDRRAAAEDPEVTNNLRPPLAHTPEEMEILLIEEGEAAQYDLKARESPVRMHLATLLYAVGLYCIAWLITHQASSILKQTVEEKLWCRYHLPDYWWIVARVLAAVWVGVTVVVALPWALARIKRAFGGG